MIQVIYLQHRDEVQNIACVLYDTKENIALIPVSSRYVKSHDLVRQHIVEELQGPIFEERFQAAQKSRSIHIAAKLLAQAESLATALQVFFIDEVIQLSK